MANKKKPIYSDEEIQQKWQFAQDAERSLREAKKKEEEGRSLPIGGKSSKMGESLFGNRKAAEKAYDDVQNMRETEVEVQRERAKRNRTAVQQMREINDEWDKSMPGTVRRDNKVRK